MRAIIFFYKPLNFRNAYASKPAKAMNESGKRLNIIDENTVI